MRKPFVRDLSRGNLCAMLASAAALGASLGRRLGLHNRWVLAAVVIAFLQGVAQADNEQEFEPIALTQECRLLHSIRLSETDRSLLDNETVHAIDFCAQPIAHRNYLRGKAPSQMTPLFQLADAKHELLAFKHLSQQMDALIQLTNKLENQITDEDRLPARNEQSAEKMPDSISNAVTAIDGIIDNLEIYYCKVKRNTIRGYVDFIKQGKIYTGYGHVRAKIEDLIRRGEYISASRLYKEMPSKFRRPPCTNDGYIADSANKVADPIVALDVVQNVRSDWQTTVLNGVSSFLIERAKAESIAAFVDNFQNNICNVPEMAALFPQTCRLVNVAGADPVTMVSMAGQTAFSADISALPENIFRFIYLNMNKDGISRRDSLHGAIVFIRFMIDIVPRIREGKEVVSAMREWRVPSPATACGAGQVSSEGCMLYLTGWLADLAVRESHGLTLERLPCPIEEIVPYLVAIVFRELPTGPMQNSEKLGRNAVSILKAIKRLGNSSKRISSEFQKISASGEVSPQLGEVLSSWSDLTFEFICDLEDSSRILRGNDGSMSACRIAPELSWLIKKSMDIYLLIAKHDYGRALLAAIAVIPAASKQAYGFELHLPKQFVKYMSFASELMMADNPDAVKRIFEAAALPAGGYRVKRVPGSRAITLSAYFGFNLGYEFSLTQKYGLGSQGGHAGAWLPIGADVMWGLNHSVFTSFGVFASVMDLGALASFRISDDSQRTGQAPEVGFAQVLSPGAFLTFGLSRKMPLNTGIGVSFSPNLRMITTEGVETQAHAVRLMAFLAIDMTLFRLN